MARDVDVIVWSGGSRVLGVADDVADTRADVPDSERDDASNSIVVESRDSSR